MASLKNGHLSDRIPTPLFSVASLDRILGLGFFPFCKLMIKITAHVLNAYHKPGTRLRNFVHLFNPHSSSLGHHSHYHLAAGEADIEQVTAPRFHTHSC